MSTPTVYTPAVRLKGAEIAAIRGLDPAIKAHIQPLFELVRKDFLPPNKPGAEAPPLEHVISETAKRIADNWGWAAPFYIDFLHLERTQVAAALDAFDRNATRLNLRPVLVTTVTPVVDITMLRNLEIIKAHGLCVRINFYEFRQGGFHRALLTLIKNLRLDPGSVDLIIDYGSSPQDEGGIRRTVESVPVADGEWRSITVLAGSMPKDLGQFQRNDLSRHARAEWLGWRRYALGGGTARYGDYLTLHANFEDPEGQGFPVPANFRYTADTDTLIFRGEKITSDLGPAQWTAHAALLCELTDFSGEGFSPGDAFIKAKAGERLKTGNAKDWVWAALSHHLAFVVFQLTHFEATHDQQIPIYGDQPDWPARII